MYKEKQVFLWNLYYLALNKFIIIVTFKTWQSWILVFKHSVKFSQTITFECNNVNYKGRCPFINEAADDGGHDVIDNFEFQCNSMENLISIWNFTNTVIKNVK